MARRSSRSKRNVNVPQKNGGRQKSCTPSIPSDLIVLNSSAMYHIAGTTNSYPSILPSLKVSNSVFTLSDVPDNLPFEMKMSPDIALQELCYLAEVDSTFWHMSDLRNFQLIVARFVERIVDWSWLSKKYCFLNSKFPSWFDHSLCSEMMTRDENVIDFHLKCSSSCPGRFHCKSNFDRFFEHLKSTSSECILHRYFYFFFRLLIEGPMATDSILNEYDMKKLICVEFIVFPSTYEVLSKFSLSDDDGSSIMDVIGDGHCAFFSMLVVLVRYGKMSFCEANMMTRIGVDPFDDSCTCLIGERPRIVQFRKDLYNYALSNRHSLMNILRARFGVQDSFEDVVIGVFDKDEPYLENNEDDGNMNAFWDAFLYFMHREKLFIRLVIFTCNADGHAHVFVFDKRSGQLECEYFFMNVSDDVEQPIRQLSQDHRTSVILFLDNKHFVLLQNDQLKDSPSFENVPLSNCLSFESILLHFPNAMQKVDLSFFQEADNVNGNKNDNVSDPDLSPSPSSGSQKNSQSVVVETDRACLFLEQCPLSGVTMDTLPSNSKPPDNWVSINQVAFSVSEKYIHQIIDEESKEIAEQEEESSKDDSENESESVNDSDDSGFCPKRTQATVDRTKKRNATKFLENLKTFVPFTYGFFLDGRDSDWCCCPCSILVSEWQRDNGLQFLVDCKVQCQAKKMFQPKSLLDHLSSKTDRYHVAASKFLKELLKHADNNVSTSDITQTSANITIETQYYGKQSAGGDNGGSLITDCDDNTEGVKCVAKTLCNSGDLGCDVLNKVDGDKGGSAGNDDDPNINDKQDDTGGDVSRVVDDNVGSAVLSNLLVENGGNEGDNDEEPLVDDKQDDTGGDVSTVVDNNVGKDLLSNLVVENEGNEGDNDEEPSRVLDDNLGSDELSKVVGENEGSDDNVDEADVNDKQDDTGGDVSMTIWGVMYY